MINDDKVVIAGGMIVPGTETENDVVCSSFRRKIYITKVLGKTGML